MNLRGELWVGRSHKRAFAYELAQSANTFRVRSQIYFGLGELGYVAGWQFRGSQCAAFGPTGIYEFSFPKRPLPVGSYLVLQAERDPCQPRRRLLEGVWQQTD